MPERMLTYIIGRTCECTAFDIATMLPSDDVLERLAWLMVTRGVPGLIRSDNGPEVTAKAVFAWQREVGMNTIILNNARRGRIGPSRASAASSGTGVAR